MYKCDIAGCKVNGYAVTVQARDTEYHFCSSHYEAWGNYLDKIEQNGVLDVDSVKWRNTLENFIKSIQEVSNANQ